MAVSTSRTISNLPLPLIITFSTLTLLLEAPAPAASQCQEVLSSGQRLYFACRGENIVLLRQGVNSVYNVTVEPESSTCGTPPNLYCNLGIAECADCDASDPAKAHPPDYLVDVTASGSQDLGTWWQSVSWTSYPEPLAVTITIAFDHSYRLKDDFQVSFSSSRPSHMVLERSLDFGATWEPWQYYSQRCNDTYPNIPTSFSAAQPDAVICTSIYSNNLPYSGGRVVFSLVQRYGLFSGTEISDLEQLYTAFDNTGLDAFLQFTGLRIRLLEPATDGNEALRKQEDLVKYYYGISGIEITASCSCNLHAQLCMRDGDGATQCQCMHNTAGKHCERCLPLFNNRPWQPGRNLPYPGGTANECQECECNSHAESCTYDPTLARGRCDNCQHNTTGPSCEVCLTGFFPNNSLPATHPDVCSPCDCEPLGVADNNTACVADGQCFCKTFTGGRRCDECKGSTFGLTLQDNLPGTCKPCACNQYGTVNMQTVCAKADGQCPCKPNTGGRDCGVCLEGYYSFPLGRPSGDCLACDCDPGGSLTMSCDQQTGECTCKPFITLQHCNQTLDNFYAPDLDYLRAQPRGGTCRLDTDLVAQDKFFTGRVFSVCEPAQDVTFEQVDGKQLQPEVIWSFLPTIRYSLDSAEPWSSVTLRMTIAGESGRDLTEYRERQPETEILFNCNAEGTLPTSQDIIVTDLAPGIGEAWISDSAVSLDVRCTYDLQLLVGDRGLANSSLVVDSLVMLPNHNESLVFQTALPLTQEDFIDCQRRIASLSTREMALLEYTCRRFSFGTTTEMGVGAQGCDCDVVGSVPGVHCAREGGQCMCKPGVFGRRCDVCAPGFYNFTDTGCVPCECEALGSATLVCDYETGQCPCLPNVARLGEMTVLNEPGGLRCEACLLDHHGLATGTGCQPCMCDLRGSTTAQCDDSGVCACKDTIAGDKCDQCQDGFYLYTEDGCTSCECNVAGSTSITCDIVTGTCSCKSQVTGAKCDTCAADSFNLQDTNPDGCQRCFCFGHSTTCVSAPGYTRHVITSTRSEWEQDADPENSGRPTHLRAPASYLCTKQSSYGQALTLTVDSTSFQDVVIADGNYPLVFLEGNGEQIMYNSSDSWTIEPSSSAVLSLPLHESNWAYNRSSRPDYFKMYALLADLTGVYLWAGTSSLIPYNLTMATTRLAGPGDPASAFMEMCTCDPTRNVAGESCQTCAQGFRRPLQTDTEYIPCEACDCSGRAETVPPKCDQMTGECLNCKAGTNGTDCGACASGVMSCGVCTDTQCGICENGFWGISSEGCQPCDCDPVGADSDVCDRDSGQCSCRRNVDGRACDQCADNHFGLSVTGCQVCNECYGLVHEEVDRLRVLRDNLTVIATTLSGADLAPSEGPFSARLTATQDRMTWLLNFLTEADRVQGPASEELSRLNQSLLVQGTALEWRVQADVQGARDNVTAARVTADSGARAINATSASLLTTNDVLLDDIPGWRSTLEGLGSSIAGVQAAMTDVSDSTQGNALRVSNVVQSIEAGSQQTRDTANEAYLKAQSAQNVHRITTNQLTQLEQFVTLVTLSGGQTSRAVTYASGNATASSQQATTALANVTAMTPITTDVPAMVNRAAFLASEADGLNTQAEQAVADSTESVDLVAAARTTTDGLLGQLQQVTASANILDTRQAQAHLLASNQQSLADQSFNDADRMLTIMSDFRNQALAVELEANKSLAQVQQIQTSGEKSIAEAIELQVDLQPVSSDADDGLATAESALAVSLVNSGAYASVAGKAGALHEYSGTVLTDVALYPGVVAGINASTVVPADTMCRLYEQQTASVQSKTDAASKTANAASQNVTATAEKANQILREFSTVEAITPERLAALQALVATTGGEAAFNRTLLTSTVSSLRDTVQSQRLALDNMKQRREQLQAQITRLRSVQEQLRN